MDYSLDGQELSPPAAYRQAMWTNTTLGRLSLNTTFTLNPTGMSRILASMKLLSNSSRAKYSCTKIQQRDNKILNKALVHTKNYPLHLGRPRVRESYLRRSTSLRAPVERVPDISGSPPQDLLSRTSLSSLSSGTSQV